MIRARLTALGPEDHVLLLTMHHIVSDGWSIGVFLKELSALYGAFRDGRPDPLPPLPIQYADYASWQRQGLAGDLLEQNGAYWRRALAGAPAMLSVPSDRVRPAKQDFAGDRIPLALDAELSRRLKALGLRHGCTLYMTLLAGWAALLGRLAVRADVVIGSPAPVVRAQRPKV